MSEEDEVFLEKSFQRTLIVSTPLPLCHPTSKAGLPYPGMIARIGAWAHSRNWKNSYPTLPHLQPSGAEQARSVTPTPSFVDLSDEARVICVRRNLTSTPYWPNLRKSIQRPGALSHPQAPLTPVSFHTGRTSRYTPLRIPRRTSSSRLCLRKVERLRGLCSVRRVSPFDAT